VGWKACLVSTGASPKQRLRMRSVYAASSGALARMESRSQGKASSGTSASDR
jgi:hypothetical protein